MFTVLWKFAVYMYYLQGFEPDAVGLDMLPGIAFVIDSLLTHQAQESVGAHLSEQERGKIKIELQNWINWPNYVR